MAFDSADNVLLWFIVTLLSVACIRLWIDKHAPASATRNTATQQPEAGSTANNESSNSIVILMPHLAANIESMHATSTSVPQPTVDSERQNETAVAKTIEPRRGNGYITRLDDEHETRTRSFYAGHRDGERINTVELDDQVDTRFENPRPAPPVPLQCGWVRDNSSTPATSNTSAGRSSSRRTRLFKTFSSRSKR